MRKSKSEKLGKPDFLKCADCHIEMRLFSGHGRYNQGRPPEDIHLFDLDFRIDYQNSLVIGYGEWTQQVYHHVMNQLQSLPHLGIPEYWTIELCQDDDSKSILCIRMWVEGPHSLRPSHLLVGQITFSNRQYVGDPKKSLKL